MKALLRKEFTLSFFALPYCFLLLAGLLLIPNYPYLVTFFYTTLGVMFLFQYNRENRDLDYMMTLPVRKAEMVGARFAQVVVIELLQVLICIPFMALRSLYAFLPNQVGLEASVALLGAGLVLLGLFNLVFLPGYYKNGYSIGIPFLKSCIVTAVYIVLAEVLLRLVPYFARYCDSMAPSDQLMQLPVLLAGAAIYALLTWWAWRLSVKRFEQMDL